MFVIERGDSCKERVWFGKVFTVLILFYSN